MRVAVNTTLNSSILRHCIHSHRHTYAWKTNTNTHTNTHVHTQKATHRRRPLCGSSGTELVGKTSDLPAVENTWLCLWCAHLWNISIYTEIFCEMNIDGKIAVTWKIPDIFKFSYASLPYLTIYLSIYLFFLPCLSVYVCARDRYSLDVFFITLSKVYLKGSTWVK